MQPDDKPNAPMTPREYVELIVLPTLHELLAARDDRRRAYLACLVICHVADSLGLAEATREPGFADMRGRTRKRAVDAATDAVQAEARRRCGGVFGALQGIANGVKHPGRLPLLPGSERRVSAFSFGIPDAGFGARWSVPGLALYVDGETVFLDACAQQVLAAFVCAYPQHLGGIALSSFMDPGLPVLGLAVDRTWPPAFAAWAAGRPEVAEVWLFGSRAKGTARPDSDVDVGLVLVPGEPGHDWPEGNYQALGDRWQAELVALMGRHVSLVAFGRPGEPQDDDIAAARAPAILLWTRPTLRAADPVSLSTR